MKVYDLYNIVLSNERGKVDYIQHHFSKDDAIKSLRETYYEDLEQLERDDISFEGDEDFEKENNQFEYTIFYGPDCAFYRAEIVHSILKMEE